MVYEERMRLRDLEEREAAGENLWTTALTEPVRRKVWYAVEACSSQSYREKVLAGAQYLVTRRMGLDEYLHSPHMTAEYDIKQAIVEGPEDRVLSIVEGCHWAFRLDPFHYDTDPGKFETQVNNVFRSHRVAFELVNGQIVPFESQELHQEVVAPALRLLSGRDGWEAVEQAYQNALREISDDPSDAITDAGTALQEALTARGCEGKSLGPLLKDAKRQGILAPHDPTLGDAIGKLVDWVSADRSEKGDGHKSTTGATSEDAWLAVHVVGALILRLAQGDRI